MTSIFTESRRPEKVGLASVCVAESPDEIPWDHIEAVARRLGLRRLNDVTGLDRIGIPVFAAVAATRTADVISVYNGKGRTAEQARLGALMELVERRSAHRPRRRLLRVAWQELQGSGRDALEPSRLSLPPQKVDPRAVPLEWVDALRLPGHRASLVPANAVFYPYRPRRAPLIFRPETTGLAAGLSWREAVERATAECVERDAISLTLCALAAGRQRQPGRLIDLESLPAPQRSLGQRFRDAGLRLAVRELPYTEYFWKARRNDSAVPRAFLPSYLAVSAEETGLNRFRLHMGAGSDIDPVIAVERAILEVAQSRLTEIQGIREDLRPEALRDVSKAHITRWLGGVPTPFRPHREPTDLHGQRADVLSEIFSKGVDEVYVADLRVSPVGLVVVRVIIPALETWYLDPDRMGLRARTLLQ